MKKLLLVLSLSLIAAACDGRDYIEKNSDATRKAEERRESDQPDNTSRNVRDRDMNTITPGDQSENEGDRLITQRIREAIIDDGSLSTNAKNIKIITINGVVTLRGPVGSGEREIIARKVQMIRGVVRLDNQLEVTK